MKKLNIESVEFKNFLSFGSSMQKIEFKDGINVIMGYDESNGKSNGSGKCVKSDTMIMVSTDCEEIEKILKEI